MLLLLSFLLERDEASITYEKYPLFVPIKPVFAEYLVDNHDNRDKQITIEFVSFYNVEHGEKSLK